MANEWRLGTDGIANDLRHVGMAGLAAVSTINPTLMFRGGALLALLLALPDLLSYRPRSADLWAVLFAGLMYASMQWTFSVPLSSPAVQNQVAVAVIFICLRAAIRNGRTFSFVATGYLGGCLFGLWGLLRENAGAQLSLHFESMNRYSVTGLNANYTAYALAAGVGVAIMLSHMRRSLWLAALATAAAAYAGIVLTGSRGGAVAVFATAAWWLVPKRFRRVGVWVVAGVVVAVSMGILTGWTDGYLRSRVDVSAGRETGDLNARLTLWPLAREAFNDHFWFGWGTGSFPALNPYGIYAHNVLLDVASGLGVVGLVVFIVLIWTTLVSGTRGAELERRALLIGTALCSLAPPMLTGYWYQSPAAWVVLALFSRMEVLAPLAKPQSGSEERAALPAATRRTSRLGTS